MSYRYGMTDELLDRCLLLIGLLSRGDGLDTSVLITLCMTWGIEYGTTEDMIHKLAQYAIGKAE